MCDVSLLYNSDVAIFDSVPCRAAPASSRSGNDCTCETAGTAAYLQVLLPEWEMQHRSENIQMFCTSCLLHTHTRINSVNPMSTVTLCVCVWVLWRDSCSPTQDVAPFHLLFSNSADELFRHSAITPKNSTTKFFPPIFQIPSTCWNEEKSKCATVRALLTRFIHPHQEIRILMCCCPAWWALGQRGPARRTRRTLQRVGIRWHH